MDSETRRKLVHMAGGLGAFVLPFVPQWLALVAIAAATFAAVLFLRFAAKQTVHGRFIGSLTRPGETPWHNGMILYATGVLIAVLIFDSQTAAIGWLALAFGDGAATLVGRRWPLRVLRNSKSLGGAIGFFLASLGALALAKFIWPESPKNGETESWIAMVGVSLGGAILEILLAERWDNLLIPVLVGTLWIALI
jgi:phytol kinase